MLDNFFNVEQLDLLFKNSDDFVFLMKKDKGDYRYLYANKSAVDTIKSIKSIVVGATVNEVMIPNLSKTILKYYDLALKTNQQQTFEDYASFSSEIKKYETTVIPIFHENEQYILATTKLIAFDRNLQDKYLFMRSIFFKSFLSTILVSPNLEVLEANPRFLKEFGFDIEKMRGKSLLKTGIFSQDSYEKYETLLKRIADGEHFETLQVEFFDHKGEKRNFLATISPLSRDDEIIAFFIILQETTQYVRQAQQLKEYSHTVELFKNALGSAADISITDTNGRIIDVNERFLNRTGYTREEVIGQTHSIVNSRFHPKEFFQDMWEQLKNGKVWRGEICNKTKHGVTYWNESTIIPLTNIHGEVDQYLGIYFNVSEKKKIMTQLRNIERTFRIITENTNDLIVIIDDLDIVIYASPSYVRLLNISEEQIVGKSYSNLLDDESKKVWASIRSLNRADLSDFVELKLQKANGEIVWTEGHFKRVTDGRFEDLGQITMVSREITERKMREKDLMFLAFHDSLTRLPNRRMLEKEFPHFIEVAKGRFESIAVCYIDGDNFKKINDSYGHDVGDEFIRAFGQIIQRCIRKEDLVVRMGGDEFIVILNHLSRNEGVLQRQITAFYKRLQAELQKGWEINGIPFNATCTMGVAFYPKDADTLEQLIDLADQMLFEAKKEDRNCFKCFKQKSKS